MILERDDSQDRSRAEEEEYQQHLLYHHADEAWTPEQIEEGRQMAYDLGDAMLKAGISEKEAEAKVTYYKNQVGEGTFKAYANRLASASFRGFRNGGK